MIDVNVKGVLYGIAAVLPIMQKQNSGHVINVSSTAGHRIIPGGASPQPGFRVTAGKPFGVRMDTFIQP